MAMIAALPVDHKVQVISLTPALAGQYLAANTKNRHVRPTVVDRYARDMAAGQWEFNGETIKIADDGTVIDGQHRLLAVVQSGVTILVVIVTGLPLETQDTIDRGAPRNLADALRLRGETQTLALAAGLAAGIVLRSPTVSVTQGYQWPSTRECLAFLDAHPEIRESVHVADIVRKNISFPAGSAVALHQLFSEIDPEDADGFFEGLSTGQNLEADSPVLRLREILIREIGAPRRMTRVRLWALTIKAWNAYRRGQTVQLLVWRTGGAKPEAFPRPE